MANVRLPRLLELPDQDPICVCQLCCQTVWLAVWECEHGDRFWRGPFPSSSTPVPGPCPSDTDWELFNNCFAMKTTYRLLTDDEFCSVTDVCDPGSPPDPPSEDPPFCCTPCDDCTTVSGTVTSDYTPAVLPGPMIVAAGPVAGYACDWLYFQSVTTAPIGTRGPAAAINYSSITHSFVDLQYAVYRATSPPGTATLEAIYTSPTGGTVACSGDGGTISGVVVMNKDFGPASAPATITVTFS